MNVSDDGSKLSAVKPPPDRLYGRARGHKLRPRQEKLLEETLPRLKVDLDNPLGGFGFRPSAVWLEVGFGGGEHALAQIQAFPGVGLIACEVFENGICSLLSRLVPEGGEADETLPGNLRLWPDDARTLLAARAAVAADRSQKLWAVRTQSPEGSWGVTDGAAARQPRRRRPRPRPPTAATTPR